MRVPTWIRAGLFAAVAGGAMAFGGIAAFAADQTVQIVAINGTTCTSAFCFVPSSVSVNSGDTVTWNNSSPDMHTVARCDATNCSGQGPGTGADTLSSGGAIAALNGTYAHTFSGAGTYFYYCTIHGYSVMHG
ncbi:MAG TPA: plastocyanin/azurin family copper-binding protein, partial [Candidatus Dormibacteraeota bacterium]|nr:plastocyanin/azurin family copper-binding protein [Candidatus Dormibacteraeota bacterium]